MRSLTWAVYAPSLLVATCLNGITILLPLYVLHLDGSAGFAAVVIGLRGIGSMLVGIPAGLAVSRFGDTQIIIAGLLLVIITAISMAFTDTVLLLAPLAFVFGVATGMWQLGRLNYMTVITTKEQRGRGIAVMAGLQRVGFLVGPAVGGLIAQQFSFEAFFYCCAFLYVFAMLLIMRFAKRGKGTRASQSASRRLFDTAKETRGLLLRVGPAIISLQMLRAARTLVLPLWGAALGLSPSEIGIAFSLASTVDMLMFYPAGWMIDYWGRRIVMIPAIILMSATALCLSLASGQTGFIILSLLGGLGNGFSTGIVMTLGGDLAPTHRRGEFLGLWRLIADVGTAGGPFTISMLVTALGLASAGASMGIIGLIGLGFVIFAMPETRIQPSEPTLKP